MDDADARQDKLTREEIDDQLAELPDREALSLVNLGMPVGHPAAPVAGTPDIGPETIEPPSQD
jgi:hypothetical protein